MFPRLVVAFFIAFMVVRPCIGEPSALETLSGLRWDYRVVVVSAPADPAALLAELAAASGGIEERRIAWFVLDGEQLHSNYPGNTAAGLAASIGATRDFAAGEVLLIGLDGGIKLRLAAFDLDALYAAIDGMPMRRYELQNAR